MKRFSDQNAAWLEGRFEREFTGEDMLQAKDAKDATAGRRSGATVKRAFTLIELLVVIAIIAILAALLLTVTGAVNRNKIRARARTELALVAMAIDNYQSKLGHYPPDNVDPATRQVRADMNPLYFELLGTTNFGNGFRTLDGSAQVYLSQLAAAFGTGPGVAGFQNCSGRRGGDEASVARSFLSDLKPAQVGYFKNPNLPDVKFLLCSIPSPVSDQNFVPANGNRFRYVSSNPTNNPNSYDLWVDVVISGKTNRICNWSKEPLIVP